VIFPGLDGGAEWGGSAFDPESGLLYVNATERVQAIRLVERPAAAKAANTRELYIAYCAGCHGTDLRGDNVPSLEELSARMPASQVAAIIRAGTGRMPRFNTMPDSQVRGIVDYLLTGKSNPVKAGAFDPPRLKYRRDGRGLVLDPEGYPGVNPPWGTLNAISMDSGKIVWKIPLGEHPELVAKGFRDTGSENYGGPVVTAGGLVFIGATNYDKKFRAFDKSNGKLLWETTLPAAGNATPSTYEVNGRQFVVIAAGGGKDRQPSGGSYVAFALSEGKK
jgi:quinoprotein glucose dehydrogenase